MTTIQSRLLLSMLLASVLAACAASGEKFATAKESLPPIQTNKARIFFYRTYLSWGAGMRPKIYACGNYAGKSIPGGVSFIDVPAGSCEITIPSQMYPGERDLIVKLAPGETKYVVSWIGASGLGGRANMEEVSEERAKKEMDGLALVGRN